jgi:hypothetical protein
MTTRYQEPAVTVSERSVVEQQGSAPLIGIGRSTDAVRYATTRQKRSSPRMVAPACHNGTMDTGSDRPDDARAREGGWQRHTSLLTTVRDPVIVILLLAGIFDGLAGNPVHAIVLISVALFLTSGVDVPVRVEERSEAAETAEDGHPFAALAIAVIYAVAMGAFERYSWPATLAVIVPGAVGLMMAFRTARNPGPEPPPIGRHGAVAWASLFVALGIFELVNLLLQPDLATGSYAHPTISTLLDPILAMHTGRSVLLFVWLLLGWYLVKR